MNLSLLSEPWIPVRRKGKIVTIRPDQIAEPGVEALAWSRPDFNLACLELLIGLISMADPPEDDDEWFSRLDQPDAGRLCKALEPFASSFALSGDGPRFLQDLEPFERDAKKADIEPVDMLYIDSAGKKTVEQNADVMVKRGRFDSIPLAEAAMALYTLQAFAPSGGRGNRTSMRGGGPMTTLVRFLDEEMPRFPLWRLVFANVLPGSPLPTDDVKKVLPWLCPTRTSEKGQSVTCEDAHPLEAFFGMPRRLRLVFEDDQVVGVLQKPYGTNYEMGTWRHPLTPYYKQNEDDPEWLAVHPKPGRRSYRNWQGVNMDPVGDRKGVRRIARSIFECRNRHQSPYFEIMAGGWAMANMKPVSFTLDQYPGFLGLSEEDEERLRRLVETASIVSSALRKSLQTASQGDGDVVEHFFTETEEEFESSVRGIMDGADTVVEEKWHKTMWRCAIRMFEERTLDGLANQSITGIEKRLHARRALLGKLRRVRQVMDLPALGEKEREKQS